MNSLFFKHNREKDEYILRIISVLILIEGATSGVTLFAGGVIITASTTISKHVVVIA
jgi:hypothetical protein